MNRLYIVFGIPFRFIQIWRCFEEQEAHRFWTTRSQNEDAGRKPPSVSDKSDRLRDRLTDHYRKGGVAGDGFLSSEQLP